MAGPIGVEPINDWFKASLLYLFAYSPMADGVGFEPTQAFTPINVFKTHKHTKCDHPWHRSQESNLHPRRSKRLAHPLCFTGMAPQSGVEPESQPSQGCVLSIVRKGYGGLDGYRTHYLLIDNQATIPFVFKTIGAFGRSRTFKTFVKAGFKPTASASFATNALESPVGIEPTSRRVRTALGNPVTIDPFVLLDEGLLHLYDAADLIGWLSNRSLNCSSDLLCHLSILYQCCQVLFGALRGSRTLNPCGISF